MDLKPDIGCQSYGFQAIKKLVVNCMGHFSILSAHLFCLFMTFKTRVKLKI